MEYSYSYLLITSSDLSLR